MPLVVSALASTSGKEPDVNPALRITISQPTRPAAVPVLLDFSDFQNAIFRFVMFNRFEVLSAQITPQL